MSDTEPALAAQYRQRLMSCSPGDRMRMASGMFDAARALIRSRLRAEVPGISDVELRVRVFTQVYGQDLTADDVGRIAEWLRRPSP